MLTEEKLFNQVKQKSITSVIALTARTIFLQLINIVGYFIITVFLERKEFGVFILVSAIVDILGYFSDIGLAAALIQKKDKPSLKEIRSTFTIQQLLVFIIILILLFISPVIKKIYNLNGEGMFLLYSFAFAFFFSSLKTIPSVLLERKLEFNKIIIPQFIETIVFNLIVVLFAWKGFGLTSYSLAIILRAIFGTITLYLLAPWSIGFNFSFNVLKKLLHFGIPYQFNSLLAVVKDKIMILLLGIMLGSEGVALIGWAEKWATTPLRYLLDNTIKVAFPAFARLQHDKNRLKIAIEKTLYFLMVFLLPSLTGIALLGKPIISLVPRLIKWQPALIPLYLYCLASVGGVIAVFVTTIFNAVGKIKTTFKLMIFWTILTWALTPFLAWKLNAVGVALAILIVNFSSIIGIFILLKFIKINFFQQLSGPIAATIIMLFTNLLIQKWLPINISGILIIIISGVLVYTLFLILFDRKKIINEFLYLKKELSQ